jgi:hypothetical protein
VVEFVAERFVALGNQRVAKAQISERFGDMAQGTLGKLLARCVERGMLTNPARGFYAPGATASRPCAGRCGRRLSGAANFCGSCARKLDAEDRNSGGRDDGQLPF